MQYTQLFRSLREAKGLSLEQLARLSRCHRNTVVNIESGRPVKLKTIAKLMQKMGYAAGSAEMRSVALLWLESISGLPFSRGETEQAARKSIATYRSGARQAAKQLEEAIVQAGLSQEQIGVLIYAVRQPRMLGLFEEFRDLVVDLAAENAGPQLKVAEDKEPR